jgi:hypothetical protein
MKPNVTVTPAWIEIEGVRIPRPHRLSPSQWLHFWHQEDREVALQSAYDEGYIDGRDQADPSEPS